MYLTNSFGRVVEVDEGDADRHIRSGMRLSNAGEVDDYHLKMAEREVRAAEEAKGVNHPDSVFYMTVPSGPDGYGMSRDLLKRELFGKGIYLSEDYTGQKVGLVYSYPTAIEMMRSDVRLIYTMFESDKIPEEWIEHLQAADEVFVPCTWLQGVFKKAGVETTVVPLGYNDRVFGFIDRPLPIQSAEPFTFVHYNSFNIRKGFMEVFQAFTEEFAQNEPVKLIIKSTNARPPIPVLPHMYPNIEVITDQVSEHGLVDILKRAHCMVYPSRGEGFGITPLEAMATGLATIVPNAHGISEYFNSKYMLEVGISDKCPALYNRFKGEDVGKMVICDVADLRRQMRYAFNHQAEMKEMGRRASNYVKKFTYQKTAEQLSAILESWKQREVPKRPESNTLTLERIT